MTYINFLITEKWKQYPGRNFLVLKCVISLYYALKIRKDILSDLFISHIFNKKLPFKNWLIMTKQVICFLSKVVLHNVQSYYCKILFT